jgi:hypothetical protein
LQFAIGQYLANYDQIDKKYAANANGSQFSADLLILITINKLDTYGRHADLTAALKGLKFLPSGQIFDRKLCSLPKSCKPVTN